MILELYGYNEYIPHTPIISYSQIPDSVHVKIPDVAAKHVDLIRISEFSGDKIIDGEDLTDVVKRTEHLPWIDLDSSVLSKDIGFHAYRFVFHDNDLGIDDSLYISYIIQNNDPDTSSYIYMKRSEDSGE